MSDIDVLDNTLLQTVFEHLDAPTLLTSVALVSRRWRDVAHSQTLWMARLPPSLADHLRAAAGGSSGGAAVPPLHVLFCTLYHTNLLQNPWLSLDEQMAARRSGGYDAPGRAKPPWLALGSGGAWAWGAAALEGLTTEPGQEPPQAPPPLSPFSRLAGPVRRPAGAVASSYGWPDLLQEVDLVEALQQRGLSQEAACAFLDSGPTVVFQVHTAGRFDCVGLWDAGLVLMDRRPPPPPLAPFELRTWMLGEGLNGVRFGSTLAPRMAWKLHTIEFGGTAAAPSEAFLGPRRALVLLRGSEHSSWAGHFGAKFAAPCLRLEAPDGSWL